jgi:N,N'-diacetyllegionaminate synthase
MSFYEKILDFEKRGETYVIAEVGSNYKSHQDLINSVQFAKNCGANAVKFQYYSESELYGPVSKINPVNPLPQLKAKADAVGVDLICSSFSPEGVKEVDPYVVAHKVASSEMSHIRILEAVKETGKPVLISTGGYFEQDIKRVIQFMDKHNVILLHCNLAYPAKFSDLVKFNEMKKYFKGPVGYSDHTESIDAVPFLFQQAGATVIEKHFNPFGYTDTPDAFHSLDMEEFKVMVSYLRNSPIPYSEEDVGRLMHIRRIVATKDLLPGDVLKEGENIGIFRSKEIDANGSNPFRIKDLEGKQVNRAVKAGKGVSMLDVT